METVFQYLLVMNSFPFVTLLLHISDVSAGPAEPCEVNPLATANETAVLVMGDEKVTIPITPSCGSGSTWSGF